MQLREINIGCFGGGTGLPSLLGGLKSNPWLQLNAVVTMFDSGGSSGQFRDELGVLPPGDVLRCALALARNEGEARACCSLACRRSSTRPSRRPHRRQPAAVDDGAVQRGLPGGGGRPSQPCSAVAVACGRSASSRHRFAPNTAMASRRAAKSKWMRGKRTAIKVRGSGWNRQPPFTGRGAEAIREFDAVIIGPGSFFTSLMPPLLVRGVTEALADMHGPVILIANLLTEGRGMEGFTAADAARWVAHAIERPVDVVIANTGRPSPEGLMRYAAEHKRPLGARRSRSAHRAGARPVLVHRDRATRQASIVVRRLVALTEAARGRHSRSPRFSG